jgi:predicted SAM-dependent methyltransferase
MLLNLGAGNNLISGAVNHDFHKHRSEIDVAWDLNDFPWPWDNLSFDQIRAIDIFEHLEVCLVDVLNECWRILRPGGKLVVKYPLYTSPTIHEDPTHRWFWGPAVFDFFDDRTVWGNRYSFYTDRRWEILKKVPFGPDSRSLTVTLKPMK